jgi:predicted transcriptional regulator of viral defense system
MNKLSAYGNIPIDYVTLRSIYPTHRSLWDKVANMEKRGVLIRLKKGLYLVSPNLTKQEVSRELIANHLYGPSYVSMEAALAFHRLIPEHVYNTTSMTIKRSKSFQNELGHFSYISCSEPYYAIGIEQALVEQQFAFLIASPQKALCDQIVYTPNLQIRSVKAAKQYLEEDLRFDMDKFYDMDINIFQQCAIHSKKKQALQNMINLRISI